MKIIYHVPVLEKMATALTDAGDYGKEIEQFILTDREWDEFLKVNNVNKHRMQNGTYEFYGVPVIPENMVGN
jgi:hypothetical protein